LITSNQNSNNKIDRLKYKTISKSNAKQYFTDYDKNSSFSDSGDQKY